MIALVDADIVVFRAGMAAERNIWHLRVGSDIKTFEYKREAEEELDRLVPGKMSREAGKDYDLWAERELQPIENALNNAQQLIRKCQKAVQCDDYSTVLCFSDPENNYRREVAKTKVYKGNRKDTHRPTYEKNIIEYLKTKWDSRIGKNEEADDIMGILQTKHGPEDSVIVSLDKDLDQIPGYKYNFMHDIIYMIDEKEAYTNLHIQMMSGDYTDNIPGLPKIGDGRARKALNGLETREEQFDEVCRMYQALSPKENWEEYLREQARLVYIRRQPNEMWDFPEDYVPQDMQELTLEVG